MKIIISNPLYVDKAKACLRLGKGSKFLGSWCVKPKTRNWSEIPVDIFYNPEPPAPFTNKLVGFYSGAPYSRPGLFVCNATSSLAEPNIPILIEDDIVYVSKYRHDFVETPSGRCIDGGRDYLRTNTVPDGSLSFDVETGNFYVRTTELILVTLEYEDENVTN